MKKAFFFLLAAFLLHGSVSAANVSVSADKANLSPGETVVLHLEINTTTEIGGQFVLYRETAPKKYEIVKILYDAPSCAVCGGALPLSRDLSANYHYVITSEGNYMAEAAFGGAADRIYFSASKPTTTTTTTTSTTTSTSTSIPPLPEETSVSLSADKANLSPGETVSFTLEIIPSEPVGGQFVLYRETAPKKYSLITVFFDKPTCASCSGEEPLAEPYSAVFNYTPTEEGSFWAEANFGGIQSSVYFQVGSSEQPEVKRESPLEMAIGAFFILASFALLWYHRRR